MKLKHNKFKNTAIIFECLIKQMTNDLIKSSQSPALNIIKKYFKESTYISKELELYKLISDSKIKNEAKFINYIDEVIKIHSLQINKHKLQTEKYNIIKELKQSYKMEDLFSYELSNYKLLASIYKLFTNENTNKTVNENVNLKFSIINSILNNKNILNNKPNELQLFENLDSTTKSLVINLMIDKYNEKFSDKLLPKQIDLIKEYINNVENKNTLLKYVKSIIPTIQSDLNTLKSDKVTKIKINQIVESAEKLKNIKSVKDEHLISILKIYELIDTIKQKS
ncbi:MAG TPA: hypothetical protein PLY35_09400 [Thermotogota bacterium]|nr:hypothetical protein [Thermotogota bacterium]